jgi:hypothetical protein
MQRVCECGKKSESEKMNQNLFSMVVNGSEVIQTLNIVEAKDKSELGKLLAMNGAFIDALSYNMNQSISGCVDLNNSMGNSRLNTHKTKTVYSLLNSPEIFVLQLAWNGEVPESEILKLMVSIPAEFSTDRVFKGPDSKKHKYALKGFFCFTGAHYLAYFRRMMLRPEEFTEIQTC